MKPEAMATLIENNADLQAKMAADPAGTLRTMSAMPLATDVWIYRIIIFSLCFLATAALILPMVLTMYGKTAPESSIALGSTALGALAALLIRPSDSR